jgi:O-antigen/teichoic acid export membrane protein
MGRRVRSLVNRALGGAAVQRVVTNSAWSVGATAASTAALFVETVVLARYLSPADYGLLLLVIAYPELVLQLLDFRVQDAMTKYLGEFLSQGRRAEAVAVAKLLWLLDVTVTAVAFLIILATAGLAARLIADRPDLAHLMILYSTGLLFGAFDTASGSLLRILDRFALSFLAGTSVALVRIGAMITVVSLAGGLEALVIARVAAEAVGTLILGGVALRAFASVAWDQRRAPIGLLRGRFREIGGFLVNTNLAGIMRAASTKLDTVLVGLLATPATVSLYKVSVQVGTGPLLLSDSLFTAVYPSFARSFRSGHRHDVRQIAGRMSVLMAAIAVPAVVVFAIAGGTIMSAVFGSHYAAAATPTLLCLIGVTVYVIVFWAQALLLTGGYAAMLLRIVAVGTAVQFATLALLVPHFGATGATAGVGLMYLVVAVLELVVVRRRRMLADPPRDTTSGEPEDAVPGMVGS